MIGRHASMDAYVLIYILLKACGGRTQQELSDDLNGKVTDRNRRFLPKNIYYAKDHPGSIPRNFSYPMVRNAFDGILVSNEDMSARTVVNSVVRLLKEDGGFDGEADRYLALFNDVCAQHGEKDAFDEFTSAIYNDCCGRKGPLLNKGTDPADESGHMPRVIPGYDGERGSADDPNGEESDKNRIYISENIYYYEEDLPDTGVFRIFNEKDGRNVTAALLPQTDEEAVPGHAGLSHASPEYDPGRIPDSRKRSFELYLASAEEGLIEAMYKTAECCYYADGTGRDLPMAFYWYSKAAENGYIPAFLPLGDMYAFGEGTEKDIMKAAEMYRQAELGGITEAKARLADLYRDSRYADPSVKENGIPQIGGSCFFGRYPQGECGEIRPVEWQILDIKDEKVLLVSRNILDIRPYDEDGEAGSPVTWKKCSLRRWLNGTFMRLCFTDSEQENILYTELSSDGSTVIDKLFLLSEAESKRYFRTDKVRSCRMSEYVKTLDKPYDKEYGFWWLRSAGDEDCAQTVWLDGCVNDEGDPVFYQCGIRPAICLTADAVAGLRGGDRAEDSGKPQERETSSPAAVSRPEGYECCTFGSFPQGENGEVLPVEWQILEKTDGRMLLISRTVLDTKPYNEPGYPLKVSWDECTLRRWLNGEFLNTAFTEEEKNMICLTSVYPEKDPCSEGDPGGPSPDRIFILSAKEVRRYFGSESERRCGYTLYCGKNAVSPSQSPFCWWLLRPPGERASYSACVDFNGSVYLRNGSLTDRRSGIRPALWVTCE